MSIDARIIGVTTTDEGTFLNLEPRERRTPAGQTRMQVLNPPSPPSLLSALIGEEVWGGSDSLMIGDTEFAKREGYARLVLNGSRP